MDRLTERLHEGCYGVSACKIGCEHDNKYCGDAETTCPSVCDCFDKLGRLEDLEESGRLVVLPEGFERENAQQLIIGEYCPSDFGLEDRQTCLTCGEPMPKRCKACWEAAMKIKE